MVRSIFIACALLAGATCAARPMLIHPAQTIDAPAGYYFFGYEYAIDGDWAIIAAATPSPTQTSPQQTHDALLYHRINGVWTFDRVLIRRVSQDYNTSVHFYSIAMNNGVAAIGSNPTRIFKRTGNVWAEIAHPFGAPPGDPDAVAGDMVWDGNLLLASKFGCPWGARLARINADNTWSPLERLLSEDSSCNWDPVHWGLSGNTAVVGTYSFDYEVAQDKVWVFRRSGTTWTPTSSFDGGSGDGDVRGNELFVQTYADGGSVVYRNDDTQTAVDKLRIVSESVTGAGFGLSHTSDVVMRDTNLFRKDAAGRYQHVAALVAEDYYGLSNTPKINGNRAISQAYRGYTSSTQAVTFFDLPATYTPSPVIATGFGNGVSPFTAQTGTFTVTNEDGNHVYRQSSLAGDFRAVLGGSDWVEQSIEADIKPTAFSGADRWVGLAVRYLDDSNYYYATLRSSGVVSIKSMRNGVFTTLAQGTFPIVAGRSYRVSLSAVNSGVWLRIDGKAVISGGEQPAAMIPHGRAALLGYKASADFDNVVAAQVGQKPIFYLASATCTTTLAFMREWTFNGAGSWGCSTSNNQQTLQQTSTVGVARALVGTPTDDQVLTSRARFTSVNGQDRWFGIAARYVDENNYYYLTLRNSNSVSLRKLVNGVITTIGTAPLTVTANTWYSLRLDAVGNELRAFVNGRQLFQAIDSSHASGQGGLLTYKTAAEFVEYAAWQP
jgi:hypothetical protein